MTPKPANHRKMPKDAGQKQPTEMIIRPITGSFWQSFRELYLYRSLFWSLTRRDIKLQFQSMYLGVAWVTVRPLLMVTLFALFKRFSGANLHVPIPYMLYV
ncbi:hypothetical protein C7293_30670, partial [filamentous cyanobacterium CCT1]